jgi:hypothetical protein
VNERCLDLVEDPARVRLPETGIPVRAKRHVPEGQPERWGAVDIAHLTRESLIAWLHSRDEMQDDRDFAVNVVLALLGHDRT